MTERTGDKSVLQPTPRTDALVKQNPDSCGLHDMTLAFNKMLDFSRQLERELAEAIAAQSSAYKRGKRDALEARREFKEILAAARDEADTAAPSSIDATGLRRVANELRALRLDAPNIQKELVKAAALIENALSAPSATQSPTWRKVPDDAQLPAGSPARPGETLYAFDERGTWLYDCPPLPMETEPETGVKSG